MPLSIQGRPDEKTAIEVIHAGLDHGITLIDTADVYCIDDNDIGHNERLVRKALDSWSGDRNSIIVATKGGLTRPEGRWERDARPEHLKQACEHSLEMLQVDRIDLYQLHAPDHYVDIEDSVAALAELREQGKIRWIGLSNVSVEETEKAAAVTDILTVQNRLNPFFREALETGVVEHCRNRGMGFLAYSPVGGGRLNRKLPRHQTVTRIAREVDASPHAVVLAWVLAKSPNIIVIPGARTVQHVVDSTAASGIELSAEQIALLDAAEFSTA